MGVSSNGTTRGLSKIESEGTHDCPPQIKTVPKRISEYAAATDDATSVSFSVHGWFEGGTGGNCATHKPRASADTSNAAEILTAEQFSCTATTPKASVHPQTRAAAGDDCSTACSEKERATVNGEKDIEARSVLSSPRVPSTKRVARNGRIGDEAAGASRGKNQTVRSKLLRPPRLAGSRDPGTPLQ